jgi:hypothetical protein
MNEEYLLKLKERDPDLYEAILQNSQDIRLDLPLPAYHYAPLSWQWLFAIQSELGKPVKIGKKYNNLSFGDLAAVDYLYNYFSFDMKGAQYYTDQKKSLKVTMIEGRLCFASDKADV